MPATPKLTNPVLEAMRRGEAAMGLSVRLGRNPEIVRIAKATGHHFLFIDGQHAIFDMETIANLASTAIPLGVAPLVRVQSPDDRRVPVLLDNGATGIVLCAHPTRDNINNIDKPNRRNIIVRPSTIMHLQ